MNADIIKDLAKELIKIAPEAWRDDQVFRVSVEAAGWCLVVMLVLMLLPTSH